MRSDTKKTADFSSSDDWQTDPFSGRTEPELDERYARGKEENDGSTQWHSFSGHERDCFFVNRDGQYEDTSAFSGLDSSSDGRTSVFFDFDRDGRLDIARVSANYPLLSIYRNESQATNNFVAIRFIGRMAQNEVRLPNANRDGYGARVTAHIGKRKIVREHRCGEGFAGQNSDTMLIGIGNAEQVDRLVVDWPSHNFQTELKSVEAGSLVTARETITEIDFHCEPYARKVPKPQLAAQSRRRIPLNEVLSNDKLGSAEFVVLMTMATWCEACQSSLTQQEVLRERLDDRTAMFGIPVDSLETPDQLSNYAQKYDVPYEILADISMTGRDVILSAIRKEVSTEATPCVIVADREGKILGAFAGIPTVSKVVALIE